MIHLDLFSGIGGFALAVDAVWDDVEHIFCEIDPFCQQVLKKHWKGSVIYGDIRELTADTYRSRCVHWGAEVKSAEGPDEAQRQPIASVEPPFLLTGGFPCQPFSQAGKRKGTADNRYLWPEMLRVIREFHPSWVIAENVRGLLTIEQGVVFQQVCLDLEREGYEVQPFIIPAVAVNAPHRRDRVWIVANRTSSIRCPQQGEQSEKRAEVHERGNGTGNAPDTGNKGLQGREEKGDRHAGQQDRNERNEGRDWNQNWLEVATRLCGVDDGLPADVDGTTISKSRHRVERLKSLGNAIVPQVAEEIMRAIKMADLMEAL